MAQSQPYHYIWTWNLRSSPEALWPLGADTNRFNRDTGLPPVQSAGEKRQANARRRLRFRRLGLMVEWQEEPFEWIYPHRFGVLRVYTRGPVAEMRVLVKFEAKPEGGTRLTYEVWATPRNLLGRLAIPIQIGWLAARQFEAAFRKYDRLAGREDALVFKDPGARLAPKGQARLEEIGQRLIQTGFPPQIVQNLCALIESADDLTLGQMRPYALADLWKHPRRQTLEMFLWATRLGLLEFRWDSLCPHCRRPPGQISSLGEMKANQHCPSCNLDFTASFDQTVELTFRPSPAIRPVVEGHMFCIAGPQTTPHVVAQQLLPPGEQRALQPVLSPGYYRLRLLEQPGAQTLRVGTEGQPECIFRAETAGWSGKSMALSPDSRLVFENATPAEQLFILERSDWNEQATPAADVTALQTFRDLFASEALRPDEPISVGSLAIVFTDLRGSTHMYREIGDAPAFGTVMGHFDVLREAITANGGAVVKTMGDAVMAVFRRPAGALQAMLSAQERLAAGNRPLWLKAAIHSGPAIAIQANERLDYFGSSVNLVARMVEFSSGEDVIIASSVSSDPEVASIFAEGSLSVEPFEAGFKGFEPELFKLWRVKKARSKL